MKFLQCTLCPLSINILHISFLPYCAHVTKKGHPNSSLSFTNLLFDLLQSNLHKDKILFNRLCKYMDGAKGVLHFITQHAKPEKLKEIHQFLT